MKKSLYARNFMGLAAIVLCSFAIMSLVFSTLSYQFTLKRENENMSQTAEEVVRSVVAYNREKDLSGFEVRMALSMVSNASGYHIFLCDTNGVVISCSDRSVSCRHIGMVVPSSITAKIISNTKYYELTNLNGIYDSNRYIVGVALKSESSNTVVGYAFLSMEPNSIEAMWRGSAGIFMSVVISVLFLTFIFSVVMTKKQVEPIKLMANAAHRFARGDFSTRVDNEGREDEIGELADAFNSMADSLEKSEKMRREFIANVSHELKTPMTTISGFADGILDGTIPQSKQMEYLAVISSETKRLSRLVRSMLDMSQMQSMNPDEISKKSFDISEVIRIALVSLERKITEHGLDVNAELPEDPVMTRGDKDSITQVVYNLIDNAIKFSDAGSVLGISLWKQGGKAFVSVENHGETIAEDELPLIFDRFHKTDKSRSADKDGVGLGLYIVKTILDGHNENIYVTSKNGITKFVFSLTIS